MTTYTPGQKVLVTLDPDYARESTYINAPSWRFEGEIDRLSSIEDVAYVAYTDSYGDRTVRPFFIDEELSAA